MYELLLHRAVTTWPWYLMRASGFAAAGLLMLLMISGIGHVTGFTYRFIEPIKAWSVHKALAFALLACIGLHVGAILIDKFVPFSVIQVLIPFLNNYQNHTTLLGLPLGFMAGAAGILATYGILTIVTSSLVWIHTKKHYWRRLHYVSYAVIFLIFLHGLLIGTDLRSGPLRLLWLALGAFLALAVLIRIWRARTLIKPAV